jgi:hypothetical protein
MIRIHFAAAVAALAMVSHAHAQQDLSRMSCADYLKAEHGSEWSNGLTGAKSVDEQSTADATKTHDFCATHPQAMAAEASRSGAVAR